MQEHENKTHHDKSDDQTNSRKGCCKPNAETCCKDKNAPMDAQKQNGCECENDNCNDGEKTLSDTEILEKELLEMRGTLQRLQAEFENYRKRTHKDNEQVRLHANDDLIEGLLPVLDSFELAFKAHSEKSELKSGMELIYSSLFTTLEEMGLKKINAVGQKFNPHVHEALLMEESDKEPNTVLEELQTGYMIHDRVLRNTKVKITKKKTGGMN